MCTYPCVSVYIFLLTSSPLSNGCQESALRVYFAMCLYLQSVVLVTTSLIFDPLLISKYCDNFFPCLETSTYTCCMHVKECFFSCCFLLLAAA
uniref:Putative secreted protein n=1 Tax=Amblyomma parvum TaxID=251391 RepID=A0A023G003_AMBPA